MLKFNMRTDEDQTTSDALLVNEITETDDYSEDILSNLVYLLGYCEYQPKCYS